MIGADAHRGFGVADVANYLADDFLHVDVSLGGDFARDHREAGCDHRFAGHAAHRVLGDQGVEHAVGDLVGQLVWVPHADRFAGKEVSAGCHVRAPEGAGERCVKFGALYGFVVASRGRQDLQKP
jgi:hypothetical protein